MTIAHDLISAALTMGRVNETMTTNPEETRPMPGRGEFTPYIAEKMEQFLGRPGNLRLLRLIPYLQYLMVNEQTINPLHINAEEREILSLLRADGHIEGGASGMTMSKPFWDFCCEILWIAYVDHEDQPNLDQGN